jgi:transcriptional regulator with XRE-family HTH domain
MTQHELARAAGVDPTAIIRIERGYTEEPRISTLRKLAEALDLQIGELIDE